MMLFKLFLVFSLSNSDTNLMEMGSLYVENTAELYINEVNPSLWVLLFNNNQRAEFNDQTNNFITCKEDGSPVIEAQYKFFVDKPSNYSIPDKGNYSLFLCICDGIEDLDWDASYIDIAPPKTSLVPFQIISWIMTVYFFILTIVWSVNWFHHPLIRTTIHTFIYGMFILELVSSLVLSVSNTIESPILQDNGLILADIATGITNTYILWIFQSFAIGLSITVEKLTCSEWTLSIVVSLIYSIPQIFIGSSMSNSFSIALLSVMSAIFIFGYITYFIAFQIFSHRTLNQLLAHMVILASRGIDATTTPTYRRIKMLKQFRIIGLVIFLFEAATTLLSAADLLLNWVAFLIIQVLTGVLCGTICYLFRIRRAMSATFFEDEAAYEVPDESEILERGSRWIPEMPLPKIPSRINSLARIGGDDYGTFK